MNGMLMTPLDEPKALSPLVSLTPPPLRSVRQIRQQSRQRITRSCQQQRQQ
jgi:hypothetical protein